MWHRLAHRVGRSSQATPAAVDKSPSASNTKILTLPDQAKQEKESILTAIDRYEEKKRAELIAIFTPASQETTPPAPSITPPPVVFGGRLPDNTGMHPPAPTDTSTDPIGNPSEDTHIQTSPDFDAKDLLEMFTKFAQEGK